ncbi:MAG TPA: tRNA lysidine(34) synthetase TilS [Kiritimatiellia bacterium]|nr:tRNA lysidine(34) synthetase TilS [Kiritimatiellia bacterium]
MLKRVHQTMVEHSLVRPGMHVIAGVSGGADSIAMLYALWFLRKRLSFQLTAAHLNHGLRGRAADQDETSVRLCCEKLGIPCVIEKTDVAVSRGDSGQSIEMAARDARHAFFQRVLKACRGDVIALAHHQEDQAETVLMRLLEGSSMVGLGGMDYQSCPKPGLTVIRPMLDTSRRDIEHFLIKHRLSWRNDASNRDRKFRRNRIRHKVIPFLVDNGFPGVVPALNRLAVIMRDEAKLQSRQTQVLLKACRSRRSRYSIDRVRLTKLELAEQRRVIRLWLVDCGVGERTLDFATIEKIRHLAGQRGAITVAHGFKVGVDGKILRITTAIKPAVITWSGVAKLCVPGHTEIEPLGICVDVVSGKGFKPIPVKVGRIPCEAYIRRDSKMPELRMRVRRSGDRIDPTGMNGSVSLKELFINAKIPAQHRALVPVVECCDEVVWVAGYRVSQKYAVPSKQAPSWRIRITRSLKGPKTEVIS